MMEITTKATTYRSWIQGQINSVLKNKELTLTERILLDKVLGSCLANYNYFHPESKSTVSLEGWKGKDQIEYIEKPDSFDIITHQKKDQDSEPKQTKRNIEKLEINAVIKAINNSITLEDKKTKEIYCKTPEIAKRFCIISGRKENKKGIDLFTDHKFEWQNFFADRRLHTNLNLVLRLLDKLEVIKYRAGRIKILDKHFSFQLNL